MKIFLICSKKFYDRIPEIQNELESKGHILTLPNSYHEPGAEERRKEMGREEHSKWKAGMLRQSAGVIENLDAVFVLNFEKNGVKNYIGGATFLEMYDAFRLGKRVFLYNDIPEGILTDEIIAFNPIVINGDLEKIV